MNTSTRVTIKVTDLKDPSVVKKVVSDDTIFMVDFSFAAMDYLKGVNQAMANKTLIEDANDQLAKDNEDLKKEVKHTKECMDVLHDRYSKAVKEWEEKENLMEVRIKNLQAEIELYVRQKEQLKAQLLANKVEDSDEKKLNEATMVIALEILQFLFQNASTGDVSWIPKAVMVQVNRKMIPHPNVAPIPTMKVIRAITGWDIPKTKEYMDIFRTIFEITN